VRFLPTIRTIPLNPGYIVINLKKECMFYAILSFPKRDLYFYRKKVFFAQLKIQKRQFTRIFMPVNGIYRLKNMNLWGRRRIFLKRDGFMEKISHFKEVYSQR